MSKIDISLIIPAYNEQQKIVQDITQAYDYFRQAKIKGEVIVSTDGVTDNTNKLVRSLQSKYSTLKLLAQKAKIGKGAALKRGVKIAKGQVIMFADAGYCVPFSYIKPGTSLLTHGYDLSIASRASSLSQIRRAQPLYRRLGARAFKTLIHSWFGIPRNISDTQCGFKLYRAPVAKQLFSELQVQGMMFDLELLLRAKRHHYKIGQFPVEWSNDPDTKLQPISGSWRILKELLRIKFFYHL